MNKLIIAVFVLLNIVICVKSATKNKEESKRMLDVLIESKIQRGYECPDLRAALLNPTQFEYLNDCSLNIKSNSDMLCLLFYNNFLKLCNYSMRSGFNLKTLLNESTINATLVKSDINEVCDHLKSVELINETLNETLGRMVKAMNKSCLDLCVSFKDNTIFPICSISSLMNNLIKQFSVVKPKLEDVDKVKVEKEEEKIKAKEKNDTSQKILKKIEIKPPQLGFIQPEGKEQNPNKLNPQKQPEEKMQNKPEDKVLEKSQHQSEEKLQNNPEEKEKPDLKEKKQDLKISDHQDKKVDEQEKPQPKSNIENKETVEKEEKKEDKLIKTVPKDENQQKVDVKNNETPENSKVVAPDAEIDIDKMDDGFNDKAEIAESQENQYDEDVQPPKNEEVQETKKKTLQSKPKEINEDDVPNINSGQIEEEDSFFFVYFMMVCAVFILGYIGYHNKQKVLALVIEGRRGRRSSRRSGRPNSANYHKLDSNLEEAVTSSVHKNTNSIIY